MTEFNPEDIFGSTADTANKEYFVRLKYKNRLEWASLHSTDYNIVKSIVENNFPELLGKDFEIQDLDGAVIGPNFMKTFLNISAHGVVLHLVPQQEDYNDLVPQQEDYNHLETFRTSTSPFSNFSKAYTGNTCSCSTETIHTLSQPSTPSSSCVNFDEDVADFLLEIPSGKRAKTAVVPYHKLTNYELKNFLISHPGGKEIIKFYKENKTLDDLNRKKLVNIVVNHMLQFMPSTNLLPCTETKIEYAKAIITLFPKLCDKVSKEGYEVFFDPVTKKGFFTNRLRNLFRDKAKIVQNNSDTLEESSSTEEGVEEKINFLKFANPKDQRDQIFTYTRETFNFRQNVRKYILKEFPRFLDTDGLIHFEFTLIIPDYKDDFKEIFLNHVPIIREVYTRTVVNPSSALVKNNDTADDWNANTNALLILTLLFPSNSSKTKKKVSVNRAICKLLVFQDLQVPLSSILDEKPSTQPFILAVGCSKASISRYYVVFDQHIISAPNNIIGAFDLCFQIHFVYDLKFDHALEHFFKFIQMKFYNMKVAETTRMIEIRTKFENMLPAPVTPR